MGSTTSSVAGALKRVYAKRAETQQNLEHRAMDEIAKSLDKFSPGGEGYFGSLRDYGNESVGAINESEAFRTIDNEHFQQYKVSPKVLVAPINVSGLVAAAAESDDEAFVNVVMDAADTAKERLLKDENRQFFGLGTGLLASPSATVSSTATSFTLNSAQYIRANMVLDICTAGTSTVIVTAIRVSDVDKATNIVYLNTSLGVSLTTANQIIKQNIRVSPASDGKEMMGLRGIVDDSTDLQTFENVDASATRIWRGRRIDGTGLNLTSDLLQRLLDDVKVLSDEEPDTIIMHQLQRRKYLDIVVPQKRYADGNMDSGFKKLEFNGVELWLDPDCQTDTVYAIKKKNIRKYELLPMQMGGIEDSDKFLRASGYDLYEAFWRHYCNFGTGRRNSHGKIVSLNSPTGVN